MSTRVQDVLGSFASRLGEVDVLLTAAASCMESDPALYSALCRSAHVLLCAHFEGYLGELIEGSLADINGLDNFKVTNTALKRKLCEFYAKAYENGVLANSKESEERTKQLMTLLDDLNPKYEAQHLRVVVKNPKESVLEHVCSRYGMKNFLDDLAKSELSVAFSNTYTANVALSESLWVGMNTVTESYPYDLGADLVQVEPDKIIADNLWRAFLDDFLQKRHRIAHGRETGNIDGHTTILESKRKLEILVYAFTYMVCSHCNPVT